VPLGIALHPVQLYAAIGHFVLAAVLVIMLRDIVLNRQDRSARSRSARSRSAEVLGTAFFAEGVLGFLLAPLSGDYADASVLFHIVTPAQAIAMLMVVLGGVCWLAPPWSGRRSQPAVHHA
jgi:prolipoprotein diacylglyceryltransferase